MSARQCRFCAAPLTHSFCDLGMAPLSNAYRRADQLNDMEPCYPLHAWVCSQCFLVQLEEFESPEEIFSDYAYFSSYSESWLKHAEDYAEAMLARCGLGPTQRVIEIASNDGYLLQYFKARGVPVLGIEPAVNVARVAEAKGIPTRVHFHGAATARALVNEGMAADLLLGNNVLAHVPDLNDFVAGMAVLLKPSGVITMEFPHLLRLMQENQFDTIYHEHFSYFSLLMVKRLFAQHGLRLFDVEELPTHGGSLRIYACHQENAMQAVTSRVAELLAKEMAAGLARIETYAGFAEPVRETKRQLLEFLIAAKRAGKTVVAYGAAAKGNTLLNYCGIRSDFIDYVVDRSPHKQGLFMPGSQLPILPPERVRATRPDYLLILPWNLRKEIVQQMAHVREWGGRFVLPIPRVEVLA
ncbi:MAG: class I SAM-dependent methyltransferase [Sterolibacterium sp.]|nr:class I SAM-dependent methyltransferase [Sterolibacterium sp.]